MELKVEEINEEYDRIDRFLAIKLPDLSRSRLQSLIKEGHIKLNGKKTKPSQPIGICLLYTSPSPRDVEESRNAGCG